ncbi:Flagellar hook-associated protein fliD [Rubrivivax sp. A210]|uniref:flagellar filament capping protein FliD n=1 Tax=Rubrivivax sp. A210 TaxID=2772301 RepID=UPI00191AC260|nr:flagellar filament capping protein FliD [Rubrivivax sp. A210]CAD5373630.1 Flagellar hook-associated protein fliD [Rubrivivax sp. A210]
MATITSLGVGSGLDINSIVSQLVAVESRPLSQMKTAADELKTQVSSYGKISSLLATLQTAAGKLNGRSLWSQSTVSSSDTAAVGVVGGSGAATGNYAVTVQSLAASQTLASATPLAAATDLVGSGIMTLEVGAWNAGQTGFTPKDGSTPATLTIAATDTLQTLRDKINSLGMGVTASLVTDTSGVRLSLRSSASGAENGFRITTLDDDARDTDATGLSRFAFDPPAGTASMERKQAASNALATVNGIAVSSASNELSGVVEGLTLQLRKASATTIDVSVASDRDAVKTAIKAFVDAYNALATQIGDQTKYDPATKTGGPLQGDSAAVGLQRQLRAVLNTPSGASASFPRLSNLGLQAQRDGTLTIDAVKLDTATADLAELRKAFANTDAATPANDGFAQRYATLARQVLGVDGSMTTRTEGLQQRLTQNSEAQSRYSDHIALYQQRLVAQYTAMDANMSKLNALTNLVTQQLAMLAKSSTGSSS